MMREHSSPFQTSAMAWINPILITTDRERVADDEARTGAAKSENGSCIFTEAKTRDGYTSSRLEAATRLYHKPESLTVRFRLRKSV